MIFVPMVRRGSLTGGHLLIGGLFYVVYLALVSRAWPVCGEAYRPVKC